jgi:hypothetical protein
MSHTILAVFLYLFLFLNICYYTCVFVIPSLDHRKSDFVKKATELLAFVTPYYIKVFSLPMIQIALNFVFCCNDQSYYKSYSECNNSSLKILHSIVAIIVLVFGLLLVFLLGDLHQNNNPFANTPISSPMRTNVIQNFFLKLVPPIIFQLSSDKSGNKTLARYFIFGFLLLDEIYSILIPKSYKYQMLKFYMVLKKTEFWIVLSAFINLIADKTLATFPDKYAAYYIILGCPLYYIM